MKASLKSISFRWILALAIAIPSIAHSEVKTITLPTAEDGDINYQFDTGTKLPVSAQDEQAVILSSGITLLPKEPNAPLFWAFNYEIKFKEGVKPISITVEDEKGDRKSLKLTVYDVHPTLIPINTWVATSEAIKLDDYWFQEMTGKEPWIIQTRFLINYSDGSKSKLHQLAVITNPMRFRMLEKFLGHSISQSSKQ